jgi:hypothetical protein
LQLHPDKNKGEPDAEAKFLRLVNAYGVLGHPDKRRSYDESFSPTAAKNKGPSFGLFRMVLFVPLEDLFTGTTMKVQFPAPIVTPWGGVQHTIIDSEVIVEPGTPEGGEVPLQRVANAIAGIYSEAHPVYTRRALSGAHMRHDTTPARTA